MVKVKGLGHSNFKERFQTLFYKFLKLATTVQDRLHSKMTGKNYSGITSAKKRAVKEAKRENDDSWSEQWRQNTVGADIKTGSVDKLKPFVQKRSIPEKQLEMKGALKTQGNWRAATLESGEPRTQSSNNNAQYRRKLPLLDKLSEKELETFEREKSELYNLYPELKDLEDRELKIEDYSVQEEEEGQERYYKTGGFVKRGERAEEGQRKITTGKIGGVQKKEPRTRYEAVEVKAPKITKNSEYRIKRASKSSASTRPSNMLTLCNMPDHVLSKGELNNKRNKLLKLIT